MCCTHRFAVWPGWTRVCGSVLSRVQTMRNISLVNSGNPATRHCVMRAYARRSSCGRKRVKKVLSKTSILTREDPHEDSRGEGARLSKIFMQFLSVLPAVLLLFFPTVSSYALTRAAMAPTARAHAIVAMAKKPVQKKKLSSSSLDFAGLGSTDTDGYRRGSLGIGENESKVIWAVVIGALVFGGGLDDETAQKIGAAQRSFYPQPPGYEEAAAARQAAKAATSPASVFPR